MLLAEVTFVDGWSLRAPRENVLEAVLNVLKKPLFHASRTMKPLPTLTCPLCGASNKCAAALTKRLDVDCWCSKLVIATSTLARVPDAERNRSCLCPACAIGSTSSVVIR